MKILFRCRTYTVIFGFLSAISLTAQESTNNQEYIKQLKVLFQCEILVAETLKTDFYGGVKQIYLGNACKAISVDTYLTFTQELDTINLWPLKKIFFDGIPNWVHLFVCEEISSVKNEFSFEIIINDSIRSNGNVEFVKKNGDWTLKNKKIKRLSPPEHFLSGVLKED